jgi:hypothetical protein
VGHNPTASVARCILAAPCFKVPPELRPRAKALRTQSAKYDFIESFRQVDEAAPVKELVASADTPRQWAKIRRCNSGKRSLYLCAFVLR